MFLVQPSSATVERVFSIFNRSFGEQQNNCLEEVVEATVMLQNFMLNACYTEIFSED